MKKIACAALALMLAIGYFASAPVLAEENDADLEAAWGETKDALKDLFSLILDTASEELNEAKDAMGEAVEEVNDSLDAAAREWQEAAKDWAAKKLESQTFAFRGKYRFGMTLAEAQTALREAGCDWELRMVDGMQALSVNEKAGGFVLIFSGEDGALSQIMAAYRDVSAGADAFLDEEAESKAVPNAADQQRDYQLIEYMLTTKYGMPAPLEEVQSAYLAALQSESGLEAAQPCRRMLPQADGAVAVDHFLMNDPQYSGLQCNVVCYSLLPGVEAQGDTMPARVSLYLLQAL